MPDAPDSGSFAGRVGMAVLGGVLGGLAVWLAVINLRRGSLDGWFFWVPITLWVLTMCVLCLWSAMSGDQAASRANIQASWRMGWTVGAIGFAIGFVGPLVVYPKSNLGPLLGILATGPLGFAVGALGAGVVRIARGSRVS